MVDDVAIIEATIETRMNLNADSADPKVSGMDLQSSRESTSRVGRVRTHSVPSLSSIIDEFRVFWAATVKSKSAIRVSPQVEEESVASFLVEIEI